MCTNFDDLLIVLKFVSILFTYTHIFSIYWFRDFLVLHVYLNRQIIENYLAISLAEN